MTKEEIINWAAESLTYQRKGFGEQTDYERERSYTTATACKAAYPRACSVPTACDLLGCGAESVARLCELGGLRASKLLGCWLIDRDSLFALAHAWGVY